MCGPVVPQNWFGRYKKHLSKIDGSNQTEAPR
jgi:hypothetical protein